MPKIDLEIVKRVLDRSELEQSVIRDILCELQSAVETQDAHKENPAIKPVKKQFVFVIADNEGVLDGKHCVGWILQLPEDEPMQSVGERLLRTAKAFNLSKMGRRNPVDTIGETCENVPGKIFKEQQLWLKTKEPVLVVPMRNRLDLKSVNLAPQADNF